MTGSSILDRLPGPRGERPQRRVESLRPLLERIKEDRSSTMKKEAPEAMHVTTDPVDIQVKQTTLSFSGWPLKDKVEVLRPTELVSLEASAVVERPRTQPSTGMSRAAYSDEALRVFLSAHGYTSEDNRGNNGALWVHLYDKGSKQARQLAKWGFNYKAGRGWWRN